MAPTAAASALARSDSSWRPLQEEQASRPVATAAEELGVPGLRLLHDFVSEQEERELLDALEQQPWHRLAKRRVQHYGFKFDYTVGAADWAGAIAGAHLPIRVRQQRRRGSAAAPASCGAGPGRGPGAAPGAAACLRAAGGAAHPGPAGRAAGAR
jgi:hypothetical protein